jgi:hypothetical protein
MGYGLGLVGAVVFDGARFTFDDRPFVIMADDAVVELGAFAL